MIGFLLRAFAVAMGLWAATALVPGIQITDGWTLLGAAVMLGIVNAVLRPLLILFTLPITVLSLGLFLLVINAATLGLVAGLFDGFSISGFWSALFGALIVSIVSGLASALIGPRGHIEVKWVKHRGRDDGNG